MQLQTTPSLNLQPSTKTSLLLDDWFIPTDSSLALFHPSNTFHAHIPTRLHDNNHLSSFFLAHATNTFLLKSIYHYPQIRYKSRKPIFTALLGYLSWLSRAYFYASLMTSSENRLSKLWEIMVFKKKLRTEESSIPRRFGNLQRNFPGYSSASPTSA